MSGEAAGVLAALGRSAAGVVRDAPEADRNGALTPAMAEVLVELGLYKLWAPKRFGGFELSVPEGFEVFQAASRLDGAFGWAATIGTGGGLFAATMLPETAAEVFSPREALIAGSGHPNGTATATGNGYAVEGRWPYASGAHFATWFTANCVVHSAEGPQTGADGTPVVRAMAIPADRVAVLDTWHTSGMRATGSHDFRIAGVQVPHAYTFDVFGEPFESGALYRYPFQSIAEVSFAGVALGVARHAIDAFDELAATKRAYGFSRPLSETDGGKVRRADAFATWYAADAGVRRAVEASWATVAAAGEMSEEERQIVSLACRHAARACRQAASVLYEVAGMSPLFAESTFGRCWRDLHTVSQHAMLAPLGVF